LQTKNEIGDLELPVTACVFGMAIAIFLRITASDKEKPSGSSYQFDSGTFWTGISFGRRQARRSAVCWARFYDHLHFYDGEPTMNAQAERIANHPPLARERRRARTSRAHFQKQLSASVPKETKWFSLKNLYALLEKLSLSVGLVALVLGIGIWLAIGLVLGKLSQEYMVTVQPFEIPAAIANRVSLSGKNAADIVVDTLNEASTHASQFHGTEYYRYDSAGKQPVALHQAIRIPVQTSYGIEVNGISIDSVLRLYNEGRYEQWVIGGDVLSSPNGLVGRIRLNQGDTAKSWETAPSAHASPSELIRDATYLMLTSVNPELLGQSYLQQGKYQEAAKVFRQWEIDNPQNAKPSYYLGLAYGYQGKEQEAGDLASWSKNIADHEKRRGFVNPLRSGNALSSDPDKTVMDFLERRGVSGSPLSSSENQRKLDELQQAELKLRQLSEGDVSTVDYRIERAKILDREALIESDLNPNALLVCEREQQAIDSLDEAIQRVPENGGLHEQRAIFLMDLVAMMKKHGTESAVISAKEKEEVTEYTRALELRPIEPSPLWGAVYAQLDLGNGEEAVDLARTITLLQPDSRAANVAYLVALEGAIRISGKATEREKEVETRLQQLLPSNIEQTQLQALWHAFRTNNFQEGLDLVAGEAKRRFPSDSTFEENSPPVGASGERTKRPPSGRVVL
jgi:tetratricopeptide (TPR) repeat protein